MRNVTFALASLLFVLAVPRPAAAQRFRLDPHDGPAKAGQVDSNSPWFWVSGELHNVTGDWFRGWEIYKAASVLDFRADLPLFSETTAFDRVMSGTTDIGAQAPGACPEVPCERWPEAVIGPDPEAPNTLYGWHVEERPVCGGIPKVHSYIGAIKSTDGGQTWSDLGIILDAAPLDACTGNGNYAFMGGIGDPAVIRSRDRRWVYFIGANYAGGTATDKANQGFLMARMSWDDRDHPTGKVYWFDSATTQWDLPVLSADAAVALPERDFVEKVRPIPIFENQRSWRAPQEPGVVYGTWTESSIHWNEILRKYVIVASRFRWGTNPRYQLEGLYAAYIEESDLATNPVGPGRWRAFADRGHSATEPSPMLQFDPGERTLETDVGYPQLVGLAPGDDEKHVTGDAVFFTGPVSRYTVTWFPTDTDANDAGSDAPTADRSEGSPPGDGATRDAPAAASDAGDGSAIDTTVPPTADASMDAQNPGDEAPTSSTEVAEGGGCSCRTARMPQSGVEHVLSPITVLALVFRRAPARRNRKGDGQAAATRGPLIRS